MGTPTVADTSSVHAQTRRVVNDPGAEAGAPLSNLMLSPPSKPAADTWSSLGDVANQVLGKLTRRNGSEVA